MILKKIVNNSGSGSAQGYCLCLVACLAHPMAGNDMDNL
jgi:hypothetical protein